MSEEKQGRASLQVHTPVSPATGSAVIHGARTSKYPEDVAVFEDLRSGCEEGYYLIEVIYDEEVVGIPTNVIVPMEAGGTYCAVCSNTRGQPAPTTYAHPAAHVVGAVARRPRYLMGRSKHATIKDWKDKLVNAHEVELELRMKFKNLIEELATAESDRDAAKLRYDGTKHSLNKLQETFDHLSTRNHGFEQDIAAIRKSIGDEKMQEILEADRG